MTYQLRDGLHVCGINGRAVLLDLPNDRYSILSTDLSCPLLAFVAGVPMTPDRSADLESVGVLVRASTGSKARNDPAIPATQTYSLAAPGGRSVFATASAIHGVWRAKVARRSHMLNRLLTRLKRRKSDVACQLQPLSGRVTPLIHGFSNTRYWIASADLCLPRSIALFEALLRKRIDATLVFGVRLDPFRAHCWVQSGGVVLNDTVEEVRKFTPILSI